FSGRRRHTRSKRDWSSDVCSSDLLFFQIENGNRTSVFLQFASVPLKIHLLTVLFGVVFSGIEMALLQTIALNIVHNLIHKQLIYGNLSLLSFEPFRFHLLASFRYLKKSNPIRFHFQNLLTVPFHPNKVLFVLHNDTFSLILPWIAPSDSKT